MTFQEFTKSNRLPAELPPTLQSLWLDAQGDWDGAHNLAQEAGGRDGSWVHAYLHRKEGDEGNAGYWYARAGRVAATGDLQAEWEQIVRVLLAQQSS